MKDIALDNSSATDWKHDQPNVPTSDFWLTMRTNVRLKQQTPPIQSFPRNGKLPLTLNQERLWFLEQLQPGSSVHNLLHTFRLTGSLNLAALEQSLTEIVSRHEILRTTFPTLDGKPVQHITSDIDLHIPVIDLQHLPPEELEVVVQQLTLKESEQPFDLTKEPLWRFQLLRLGTDEYIFNRTIHHIIFDGWSHNVFLRELGVLYEAFSTGKPSPLPKLSIQYADFALTQRQWQEAGVLSSQLDYWKQQFSNTIAALELPIDYSRSTKLAYQGGCEYLVLAEKLTVALKVLSHQQGVTLFATLLTAFKTLLHRYTQQNDLLVCSPIASRHNLQTKGLIGYFNNVVVMRTNLSGNPSFEELLSRVSQVTLEAYANQDISLQQVADLPNLLLTPLTRSMFVLQNIPNQTLFLEGLTISSEYVERAIANFDLSLSLQEKNSQLTGVIQYKTDLFAPSTIAQILDNFQTILEYLVADPTQHLSDLPLLRSAEPDRISNHVDGSANFRQVQEITLVSPRDELELKLTNIWKKVLGKELIGVTHNFFDLGGHSLLAVQLFTQIEQIFGKSLPLATLFQAATIEQLANILRQNEWSAPWSSLVAIQPHGSKPPLFCIHAVGPSILNYRNLVPYLDANQPIYGLQAQGLDGGQAPLTRIEDMADHYIKEIQMLQPHGPYFLAGHSFGGLVAFEMTRQFHLQGQKVGLLALFDTLSPQFQNHTAPFWYQMYIHSSNLSRLNIQNKLSYFLERLQGGIEKLHKKITAGHTLQVQLPENYLRIEDADREALKNYVPDVYPGEAVIFRAIERDPKYYYEPELGWNHLITGKIEIQEVPGHHLTLILEPRVRVLAEKLQACLNKAQTYSSEV
jgi:thioesterase domain-containing protein/acyl carrier protein/NRPS condensation-like uncharacterized protein